MEKEKQKVVPTQPPPPPTNPGKKPPSRKKKNNKMDPGRRGQKNPPNRWGKKKKRRDRFGPMTTTRIGITTRKAKKFQNEIEEGLLVLGEKDVNPQKTSSGLKLRV